MSIRREENNPGIWHELVRLEREGIAAALVTVIRTQGSTPREVGARMIVRHDGSTTGTIGGSAVEALVIKDALTALHEGKARIVTHNLNDAEKADTGMICGGSMEFFLEPLRRVPRLYIFGGGHIGWPLTRLAVEMGYPYHILDDRAEYAAPERFPQAVQRHVGPFNELAQQVELTEPAFVVIITRCHDTDLEVLRGILGRPYEYLGLICSRRKKTEVFKILMEEGFSTEELDRIHAPVGLEIGSQTPAEIAISIMAEVIKEFKQMKA